MDPLRKHVHTVVSRHRRHRHSTDLETYPNFRDFFTRENGRETIYPSMQLKKSSSQGYKRSNSTVLLVV